VAALDHASFLDVLAGSPLTEEAIHKIVQSRLKEHQAIDLRKRR
jgi:hypothetical protein